MPGVKQLEENARNNLLEWGKFEEDEQFKKVYKKKTEEERNSNETLEREREGLVLFGDDKK